MIICYSADRPSWKFNGGPIPHKVKEGSNFIKMPYATDSHTGKYQCCGTLKNGKKFKDDASVYVGGKLC